MGPVDLLQLLRQNGGRLSKRKRDHATEIGELRQVGAEWIERGSSAVLIVPSAVVPHERDIITNPQQADFDEIVLGPAEPYFFDTRLLKS